MSKRLDMLHLPVMPVDWYQGPIEIVAVTTEGGTVYPVGEPCPGSHLMKFGFRKVFERYEGGERVAYTQSSVFNSISDVNFDSIETDEPNFESMMARYELERNTSHLSDIIEALYEGSEVSLGASNIGQRKQEYYAMPWGRFSEIRGELVDAALFLDPEKTTRYTVTPRKAIQAFDALAKVGFLINNGNDEIASLIPFFEQYGFPRDGNRERIPRSASDDTLAPGIVFSTAKYQALLAHVCSELWSCIERKDYPSIASMAYLVEPNNSHLLSFIRPHQVSIIGNGTSLSVPYTTLLRQIKIEYIPQDFDSTWRTYAKNWLYSVAENQISSLFGTRIPSGGNSFSIGVRPGGLQTAMWLTFAEKIYRSDNPHEGMRQCKQGGKFHGCGEWYLPDGSNDRSHYCPSCRAKAGAERVARFRAKP